MVYQLHFRMVTDPKAFTLPSARRTIQNIRRSIGPVPTHCACEMIAFFSLMAGLSATCFAVPCLTNRPSEQHVVAIRTARAIIGRCIGVNWPA
ncbi:hypothetical protein [Rhizobium sp. N324]|uniref:hypothetical protein n=1 Tax=Rhizobium sp. N324 TaxID=1703969 RepID=UPI0011AB320D|nr:hypothetical protein [Rhizobium sp. N324]